MTTIRRRNRPEPLPRYYVATSWCQVTKRHMYTVIDRKSRSWARGTQGDGYRSIDEADAICAVLTAKEQV